MPSRGALEEHASRDADSQTDAPKSAGHGACTSMRSPLAVLPGFTLVPTLDVMLIGVAPALPIDIALPDGFPNGLMLYFQQAFVVNGTEVHTSNAIALEIVR